MSKSNNSTIGSFLKKQRLESSLTQKDLASAFNLNSTQFISNWERGISLPPAHYLPKLCQLLNIEPKILINLILEKFESDLTAHFHESTVKEKKKWT